MDGRRPIDMARHLHPSPDHTLLCNPNSFSSSPPHQAVVGSSPPEQTKMASSSGDFFLTRRTTTMTKPLTMFYNGGVAVFHLPQDKAEDLLKMAAGEDGGAGPPRGVNHGEELLVKLREEEMPIASKRSLQRFFQKRKERLYRP